MILFLWINFLTEELTDFLDISSPLDLSSVVSHKHSAKVSVQAPTLEELSTQGAVGYSVDSDSGVFDTTPCDVDPLLEGTNAKQSFCDNEAILCDMRAVQDIL